MNQPKKKPLTRKQRRLRTETCAQLTSEGFQAEPTEGSMRGELFTSQNFPWMAFGIHDTPPSVQEISALVRRLDSPGFVAVMQPTEFPFAIVEWRTFTWLLGLARDCEEEKIRKAAENRRLPPDFVNTVNLSRLRFGQSQL